MFTSTTDCNTTPATSAMFSLSGKEGSTPTTAYPQLVWFATQLLIGWADNPPRILGYWVCRLGQRSLQSLHSENSLSKEYLSSFENLIVRVIPNSESFTHRANKRFHLRKNCLVKTLVNFAYSDGSFVRLTSNFFIEKARPFPFVEKSECRNRGYVEMSLELFVISFAKQRSDFWRRIDLL